MGVLELCMPKSARLKALAGAWARPVTLGRGRMGTCGGADLGRPAGPLHARICMTQGPWRAPGRCWGMGTWPTSGGPPGPLRPSLRMKGGCGWAQRVKGLLPKGRQRPMQLAADEGGPACTQLYKCCMAAAGSS
jgi:hypothetical protein